MTTRRRGPSRSRAAVRGPRRRTDWDTVLIDRATIGAGGQGVTDLMSGFMEGLRKGLTIIRSIGEIQIEAVTNSFEISIALAYVPQEPAAAGVFPDPSSDASFPWMWWHRLAGDTTAGEVLRVPIDVKSKRRFRDASDRLYMILDNDGANSVTYSFGIRMLYMLP